VTRFTDEKSKEQISTFRLFELHAARWRNARNLERWNDSCRERWEIEQLGAARQFLTEFPIC
jgi:hypothetical protein